MFMCAANASPVMIGPDESSCVSQMREACQSASPWQDAPLMFGLHMGSGTDPLPYVDADIAAFLLMRGPWAWAGAGVWGMSWPVGKLLF